MQSSVECKCEPRFTCGYCMRTAKPWFFTLKDGSVIYEIPFQTNMLPIDTEFNAVILHMVRRHVPHGYTLTSKAMESFEQMREMFEESGQITVNTDYSEDTIFGSASVNWAFRAWHDSCHLELNADFSPEGERRATELQVRQLEEAYREHPKLQFWINLLDIEVNGQVEYYLTNGTFPVNQLQFTLDQLKKRGYENGLHC